MARQSTDDLIHRFQPRLIEVAGSVLPVHFRYAVLSVFAVLAPVTWLVSIFLPGMTLGWSLVCSAAVSGFATYKVSESITGDRTLRGAVTEWWLNTCVWLRQRRVAAAATRGSQPYRYTASHVRHEPESTPTP